MIGIDELRNCVGKGLEATKKDGVELEVFASWNELVTMRLNYTSDIPSMGVQEPKSTQSFGVGVQAVFKDKGKVTIGRRGVTGFSTRISAPYRLPQEHLHCRTIMTLRPWKQKTRT